MISPWIFSFRCSIADGRTTKGANQVGTDPGADRAAIRAEVLGRREIAAGLRVDQRAISGEELIGVERCRGNLLTQACSGVGAASGGRALGAVLAPNQDVADALLQLTDVARPRI